eukprot:TRINITY_DN2516_c0_g1_i7.p1 TRINITY_DN2516_c0_g1~~TRINITY_DN2516_c0_g1_i7.p1  ORF type:complete len:125 (-),score=11.10 TRINITY_DN2516_c0_g1_i7:241-615(-)
MLCHPRARYTLTLLIYFSQAFDACIYCHLDSNNETIEVKFCPPDEGHLDEMFYAFSQGVKLNPVPVTTFEETQGTETGYSFCMDTLWSNRPSLYPNEFLELMMAEGVEAYDDICEAFDDLELTS